ncbi:uncharacterized protein LOC21406461 [Morus notabilis]|uniref:uncharacterized protein LOC21406461 n=1 Tax=Morus notabilis TaxID=981085 RepID=UPI000CED4ABB|nr:uncharacterized protein LOC21406461 [Morus notabilis]
MESCFIYIYIYLSRYRSLFLVKPLVEDLVKALSSTVDLLQLPLILTVTGSNYCCHRLRFSLSSSPPLILVVAAADSRRCHHRLVIDSKVSKFDSKSFLAKLLDCVNSLPTNPMIFKVSSSIFARHFQVLLLLSTSIQFALVSNLYFISQLLYRKFSGNFLVNLLGKWKESEYSGGQYIPVGGLAYYITAPSSLADMAANPFHALFYLVFMLSACALF